MKLPIYLVPLLLVGCVIPAKQIVIDSDPQGARVYFDTAINEESVQPTRNYIGTTPFTWLATVNGAGEFIYPHQFMYNTFVPPVAVITAVSAETNYPPMKKVLGHGKCFGNTPDKAPAGVFFDFKRPDNAAPEQKRK